MYRGRRLRKNATIRNMMKETRLDVAQLIYPLFVVEGENIKEEISTMPDVYHYSIDCLKEVIDEMKEYGVMACLLFGIPKHKDACGSEAYAPDGIVQRAIRKIKELCPEMYVIGDVCMCEYTDHGHCGILDADGYVNNDKTLPYLAKIACSYAASGVDMVAPSDMMDHHIDALRTALDKGGYTQVSIMGYSAKYASNFYGPFREAAHSAPSFGDRKSYQMDIANKEEAMREIRADIEEGVDVIMVKPAMAYLDIIAQAKDTFGMPLAAYQVSGEYTMLKHAIKEGFLHASAMEESLLSIKRAGADWIITYEALAYAKKVRGELYEFHKIKRSI